MSFLLNDMAKSKLNRLPKKIIHGSNVYKLFIYPSSITKNGWCVEYAFGRYYCDSKENDCCANENGVLHGFETDSLQKAVHGMHLWLEEAKQSLALVCFKEL